VGGLLEVKFFLISVELCSMVLLILGYESMAGSCTSQHDNVSMNTVATDILHYILTVAVSSQCYTNMTPC